MQKSLLLNLILLFLVFNCSATNESKTSITDSLLPPCINLWKKNNLARVSEYNYKGQRWFVFEGKKQDTLETNISDRQTIIKFYNDSCNLVCTWIKGGIAGMNRVKPDSIEKEKIFTIYSEPYPVSDTLMQIAFSKKSIAIDRYEYKGQILYKLIESALSPNELNKKGIKFISECYYNEKGKIVLEFRRATASMFYRAQRWIPADTEPTRLKRLKNIWKKIN
ncbi:MAG TPA: hypothetical protein PK275_10840 [Chitinophagaceae bacterium]|nr:hypothetical protein [Chitinophagaceae bacterium]